MYADGVLAETPRPNYCDMDHRLLGYLGFRLTMAKAIGWIPREHNYWLVVVFCAYLVLLLFFAAIYYGIHYKSPNSFAFNNDVSRMQDATYRASGAQRAERLGVSVSKLESMDLDCGRGDCQFIKADRSTNVKIRSQQGYEADFLLRQPISSAAAKMKGSMMSRPWKELCLRGPDGEPIAEPRILPFREPFPTKVSELRKILGDILEELRRQVETNLDQATSPLPSPRIWSYWDFLYFSTITQSTVGYGDILPNSTVVRMVVALQVLVGCALVIVILNLVISGS